MKKKSVITHLFLDIGGVLLTNGWDHHSRKRAAEKFKLNFSELDERHRMAFEVYEKGNLSLKEYLDLVIFTQKRSFTRAQFWRFMCEQSKPCSEMLEMIKRLKEKYGLKIFVVSNEARELNDYRIKKFKLTDFVDAFISSSLVGLRKPDPEIFLLALNISQAKEENIIYIENTQMFVEIAEALGIQSILHTDYKTTCSKLALLGLKNEKI